MVPGNIDPSWSSRLGSCLVGLSWALLATLISGHSGADPLPVDATLFWSAQEIGEVVLGPGSRVATLTTLPIVAPFPFKIALPSWNVSVSPGTGLRFALRVRPIAPFPSPQRPPGLDTPYWQRLVGQEMPPSPPPAVSGDGDWSPWLTVGDWGEALPPSSPDETVETAGIKIDVDTLLAESPVTTLQWRVTFGRDSTATGSPELQRLALCVTGETSSLEAQRWRYENPEPGSNWSGVWPVPFRSQKTDDPRMKSSLCSPTTTYMALSYAGISLPALEDFAQRVYDKRADLFGVWPRAVAAASERGVPGYVSRIRSWEKLRAVLSKGHLVGASIRFKKEDLKRPPPYATGGHLTLIRGVLPSGEIVTNDPASSEAGEGFTWLPEDFAKAWWGRGGVAYVFEVGSKANAPKRDP